MDSPVLTALRDFFRRQFPDSSPRHILVAFSGGIDSTCLLWGLRRLSHELTLRLTAAHFDHRLDSDSTQRALGAQRLAEMLDVAFELGVSHDDKSATDSPDGGLEATARRLRYRFLDDLAARLSADVVATAHHLDDQAETVLLRMRFGSGLQGLSGIQPRLGRRIRPLLGVPRRQLVQAMETLALPTLDDPTNRDLRRPRNFIRHRILPHLDTKESDITLGLATLADSARRARSRIDRVLHRHLAPRPIFLGETFAMDRRAVRSLPEALLPHALALLARLNGAFYPISAEARAEVLRQMQSARNIGCDCGHGWRLEGNSVNLWMRHEKPSPGDFAYTLGIPGSVVIPPLGLTVVVRRDDLRRDGLHPAEAHRGLDPPEDSTDHILATARIGRLQQGQSVQVRNRRPGDRLWPSGSPRERRLNDVLTNHRVPHFWRDRLPLLVVDGNITWVPGVTISDAVRTDRDTLGRASDAWILTIERRPRPTQKSVAVRVPSDDGSKERSKP